VSRGRPRGSGRPGVGRGPRAEAHAGGGSPGSVDLAVPDPGARREPTHPPRLRRAGAGDGHAAAATLPGSLPLLAPMDFPPARWRQIHHRGAVVRWAGARRAEQTGEGATSCGLHGGAATRGRRIARAHPGAPLPGRGGPPAELAERQSVPATLREARRLLHHIDRLTHGRGQPDDGSDSAAARSAGDGARLQDERGLLRLPQGPGPIRPRAGLPDQF
jgi:hypothetical protein